MVNEQAEPTPQFLASFGAESTQPTLPFAELLSLKAELRIRKKLKWINISKKKKKEQEKRREGQLGRIAKNLVFHMDQIDSIESHVALLLRFL